MFEADKDRENRLRNATDKLELLNWISLGKWLFFKAGKIYDLSAADLDQLDRIENEGLFIVAE